MLICTACFLLYLVYKMLIADNKQNIADHRVESEVI